MSSRILIPLLCVGAVAFACGPRSRSEASALAGAMTHAPSLASLVPTPKPSPVTPRASGAKTSTTADSVKKLSSAFDVKVESSGLRFALAITNPARKHVELTFPDGQAYDFAVVDSVGREVARWGTGRMFTQSVQNKLLDGGETMRIDESITKSLPKGRYVAVATLRSSNFPVEQRTSFELR